MSESRKTVSIRLAIKDHEVVTKALKSLGAEGERALQRIEKAGAPATNKLLVLNAASQEGQRALQNYANRLGPVGSALSAIGPYGMAAAAGITALVAAGGGLVALALRTANVRDELNDMSKQTTVSVENLSTLRLGLQQAGSSLEDFSTGTKGLGSSVQAALDPQSRQAKLFALMGVQVTDAEGKLRPLYELFLETSDGLNRFSSETERNTVAQDLMGRSYQSLLPFMVQGSAEIKKSQEEMRKMGGEISTADALLADQFNDNLEVLGTRAEIAGQKIGGKLLPALAGMVDKLGEAADKGLWEAFMGDEAQAQNEKGRMLLLTQRLALGQKLSAVDLAYYTEKIVALGQVRTAMVDVDDLEAEAVQKQKIQLATIAAQEEAEKRRAEAAKRAAEEAARALAAVRSRATNDPLAGIVGALTGSDRARIARNAKLAKDAEEMAAVVALGFSNALQTNESDFYVPAAAAGEMAAVEFRSNFSGVLAESYEDLLSGNFEDALKGVAEKSVSVLVGNFAFGMGEKTAKEFGLDHVESLFSAAGGSAAKLFTDGVKTLSSGLQDFFMGSQADAVAGRSSGFMRMLDTAIPSEQVGAKGRAMGTTFAENYKSGVAAFLLGMTIQQLTGVNLPTSVVVAVSLAQTFTADFAKDSGGVWKSVHEGMSSAIKGAAMGAGIGQLIGDDITAQKSSIAGAIGAVLGSVIPGVGPMLGSTLAAALIGVVDKVFYENERSKASGNLKEIFTDVQAFGGLEGFFSRIGGLSGISGGRLEGLMASENEGELRSLFRIGGGATGEQAAALLATLRQAPGILGGGTLTGVSAEMLPQLKNVMERLGFSGADIAAVNAAAIRGPTPPPPPVESVLPRESVLHPGFDPNPPQIAAKPAVQSSPTPSVSDVPLITATTLLTRMFQDNTVSRSALRALGGETLARAADRMGGIWPTYIPPLKGIMAGSPQDELWLRTRGVDVVAAQGFSGIVDRPVRFLAGEAGPEKVEITPLARAGGGDGRGLEVHLHIGTIQTPDVGGFQRWVQGPAMDWIKQQIYRESFTGNFRISSKALID